MKRRFLATLLAVVMVFSGLTILTTMSVAAEGEDPPAAAPAVDYVNECITINNYTFNGTVEYMYALTGKIKKDLAGEDLAAKGIDGTATITKEKWYPIYGNKIDITKYIPSKVDAANTYYITIKKAGTTDRKPLAINARANEKVLLRLKDDTQVPENTKNLYYNPADEEIVYTGNTAIQYKTNLGAWVDVAAASEIKIDVSTEFYFLSGAFTIRTKGVNAADPTNSVAPSKAVKISIPAQPKAPAITATEKTIGTGEDAVKELYFSVKKGANDSKSTEDNIIIKTGYAYVCDTPDGEYVKITETLINKADKPAGISVTDLKTVITNSLTEEDGSVSLYFRTGPTAKNPKSAVKKVTFDATYWTASTEPTLYTVNTPEEIETAVNGLTATAAVTGLTDNKAEEDDTITVTVTVAGTQTTDKTTSISISGTGITGITAKPYVAGTATYTFTFTMPAANISDLAILLADTTPAP